MASKGNRFRRAPDGKMPLDAIGWENAGEDPDVWVEVPEGVDCGTFASHDGSVDAIGASYETDESGNTWRAVMVIVVEAATGQAARDRLIERAATVADELLGFEDDDQGGDEEAAPPELPPPNGGKALPGARVVEVPAVEVLPSRRSGKVRK